LNFDIATNPHDEARKATK